MIREISSPLDEYTSFYREEHLRNVTEFFDNLVKSSGMDVDANAVSAAELKGHRAEEKEWKGLRSRWQFYRVLIVLGVIACIGFAFKFHKTAPFLVCGVIGLTYFFIRSVIPNFRILHSQVGSIEEVRKNKEAECRAQMLPLNELHQWGNSRTLFQKTMPEVDLDLHFTNQRLTDLTSNYGLSSNYLSNKSVVYTQSGRIKRNPFVIVKTLNHWMGSKTYRGSITIWWTERQKDANGNWVNVRKSQILVATVREPFPEYNVDTKLFYGHEAAPQLSFSRKPSRLSGSASDRQVERKAKKVDRKGRKATKSGKGNLTTMANREFEALFHAIDRSDEVQFRMLFTPLAQQEMVKILNDSNVGTGDDFTFAKAGKLNILGSKNLAEAGLDDFPTFFWNLDLAEARAKFIDFNVKYFRCLYFGLAPLLTIPLYQDERSIPEQFSGSLATQVSSWDHEMMAHWIGQHEFAHPQSATLNLLRASSRHVGNSAAVVSITAYGYQEVSRMTIVPMYGRDGNWHEVPVHWYEYIPVERTSQMLAGITSGLGAGGTADTSDPWTLAARAHGVNPANASVKGTLAAAPL